jgi:alkylation response protein AidB-like acyl-CoA dehydrogenase
MDFGWTAEQEALYQRVLTFARDELNHEVRVREREQRFGAAEWRQCGEFGLLGLSAPERYQGLGLGALTTARAIEALGEGCEDTGLVFSISAHLLACVMPIALYGSEALCEQVLGRLCTGEWIGANAITEPEAGSDVYALRTTAVREGETYVLNGTKTYVTNGPVADCVVVYAATQPAHGYLGVSAFVVEKGTPGLGLGQPFVKMGLTTSPTSSMYLQDCRVPASHLLGQEGQGAAIFTASMRWERSCLFAGYLGAMERQLERVIAFARERRQFRKTLGQHQAIAHRIADMKLRLEAARLLLYRACWLIDRNEEAALEVSLAKLAVSEAAIRSGLDAIQIHGGLGYIVDSGVEQMLRDAIPATIFSGTSEIQRDIIARRLGL